MRPNTKYGLVIFMVFTSYLRSFEETNSSEARDMNIKNSHVKDGGKERFH